MAATMSVSSGTILASSTILYNDLYLRFVRKGAARRTTHLKEVTITRLFALLIGVVVMVCSLWINDVLVGIDICYGYLSGCVFVPLVASFVLKRFSESGAVRAGREHRGGDGLLRRRGNSKLSPHRRRHGVGARSVRSGEPSQQAEGALAV